MLVFQWLQKLRQEDFELKASLSNVGPKRLSETLSQDKKGRDMTQWLGTPG